MKYLLLLLLSLSYTSLSSQFFDLEGSRHIPDGGKGQGGDEENFSWLNESRFGFNTNDLSLQGTAQILEYNIGDEDKFYVPLLLLFNITGEGFEETTDKQLVFNNLLNPTGGVFNALLSKSFKVVPFSKAEAGVERPKTSISIIAGGGYKLLNGRGIFRDSSSLNLSTLYGDFGLRFMTGSWVKDDTSKKGTFGIQTKLFGTAALGKDSALDEIFGLGSPNSFLGISSDIVLFISNEIDLRFNISIPLSQERIDDELQRTVINFSVNYFGDK